MGTPILRQLERSRLAAHDRRVELVAALLTDRREDVGTRPLQAREAHGRRADRGRFARGGTEAGRRS